MKTGATAFGCAWVVSLGASLALVGAIIWAIVRMVEKYG
jgi:flagellar biogenesis protein FliO